MKEETITIMQDIKITYSNPESRELIIKEVLTNTNWIAISEGTIQNKKNKYQAFKTDYIRLVKR